MHLSLSKRVALFILASSVCGSLQHLFSTLAEEGDAVSLLGSPVQSAVGREEPADSCRWHVGSARSSRPHWVRPTHGVCAFRVCISQALGCSAGDGLRRALGCVHFPGLNCSGSGPGVPHKGAGLRSVPVPGPSSSRDRVLGEHSRPQLEGASSQLPRPSRSVFRVYNGCAFSGTRVSLLGSRSLAATLLAGADCPESQGVLVSHEARLQFGGGCLPGAAIAPVWLWLPRLSVSCGDGPACSWLALLSPLFCEQAWQCLSLALVTG